MIPFLWPPIALSGAVAQAAYSAGAKVLLARVSPYFLAGVSFLSASGVLLLLSYLVGFPVLSPDFFPAVAVTVAINIAGTLLFYRALTLSDLSLCLPMLSFTPVFLLLTSALILGEVPTPAGVLGICLVAGGSYLLAARETSSGLLAPLARLSRDPGVRLMFLVAFLYSISVNYDKVVVETSDPVFGSVVTFGLLAAVFLLGTGIERVLMGRRGEPMNFPFIEKRSSVRLPDRPVNSSRDRSRTLLLLPAVGLVLVLEAISINVAYTMTIVPYVISIKRLSIFFAVLFGGYFLKEGDLRPRAAGSLVMIAGTVLIALWG